VVHPEQALEMIDQCPAFRDLTLEARRALARCCGVVEFVTEDRIVPVTEPLRRILIIIEGRAKLVGLAEGGVERILYVYHPGDMIGSRILLAESAESPFEVVAMGRVLAVAFPKREFMAAAREHPDVFASVTRVLLQRVDRLSRRMLAAMSTDATMRLAKLLLDFAVDHDAPAGTFVSLKHPLTHETMAQMIGASRPHTTTLLRDLEKRGLVRRLRPRGLLVAPAGLMGLIGETGTEATRRTG
jgi:CRP/FNR family transcriptional regulator, cyclic AMP receptor protein